MPRAPSGPPRLPHLLLAFPEPRVVPLPSEGEAVGRAWCEAFGVADVRVSRQHARFSRRGGTVVVEDLGSRNGLYVDGERLPPGERVSLVDGSVLRLGRSVFVLRTGWPVGERVAPPLTRLVAPFGLRELREHLSASCALGARANWLLLGETGTGKELLAAHLAQQLTPRGKYGALNLAAIPPEMAASQLFGHVRGAFTGAATESLGFLRAHHGGAVFLDELSALPRAQQAALLRFLQEREIQAVGSARTERVELLVIAAAQGATEAHLQRDVFERFQAQLSLPPLRSRPEDLYAIARALQAQLGLAWSDSDPAAVERLMLHDWPGNVRELGRVLLQALANSGAELSLGAIEALLGPLERAASGSLTRAAAEAAVEATGGNKTRAAKQLGVSLGKLRRTLERG